MIKQVPLKVGATKPVPTGTGQAFFRRSTPTAHTSTRPAPPLRTQVQMDGRSEGVPIKQTPQRPAPHIMLGWERKF